MGTGGIIGMAILGFVVLVLIVVIVVLFLRNRNHLQKM